MINEVTDGKYTSLERTLRIDCEKCSGFCCVALYFAKQDGFPANKAAGKPCKNLMPDFRCAIHSQLCEANMKGCLAYDCMGAGQKVTQDCCQNGDWRTNPKQANEIFEVFKVMTRLHQMLWYLIDASRLAGDAETDGLIDALICENERMTALPPNELLRLDVRDYQTRVNQVLVNIGEKTGRPEKTTDFIGKNLKKANLDNWDFSMALMIAADLSGCSLYRANFLGADMRDANIRDADLSESLFLTQMQVNSANGNGNTKLPLKLARPFFWPPA